MEAKTWVDEEGVACGVDGGEGTTLGFEGVEGDGEEVLEGRVGGDLEEVHTVFSTGG
jgi:hypothetical protein